MYTHITIAIPSLAIYAFLKRYRFLKTFQNLFFNLDLLKANNDDLLQKF